MAQDCVTVWNNCLQYIKGNIEEQSFNTWFSPIVPVKLVDKALTIQVPSQFFYEWLEEHYAFILRKAIDQELGKEGRLEYSVIIDRGSDTHQPYTVKLPTQKQVPNRQTMEVQRAQPVGAYNGNGLGPDFVNPFHQPEVEEENRLSNLNPLYSFESYIEGDCNRLARSAGYAIAKKPGVTSFNPLMLYGGVGLGKTHLVQAIGNEIKANIPRKFVLYVPSEKFISQFIDALKNNRVQDFTNYYMQVDVLILDDVQFLAGKDKTQEIFFHIFNHLHQSGKQIVMTSDCPPKDLKGLHERLVSRFKWGLTADLTQPDFETRMAIIKRKMESEGIYIPDNVVEYLAYSVESHVRDLEGVLISLMFQASIYKKDVDLELAKKAIKSIVEDNDTEVGIDFIQKTVAEYFGVRVDDLKDKTRKKEIVIARQVAMYFCKDYTQHTLKTIGDYFGGRDHTTVIHAVQTVNDMMDLNAKFKAEVEELKKKLKMKII